MQNKILNWNNLRSFMGFLFNLTLVLSLVSTVVFTSWFFLYNQWSRERKISNSIILAIFASFSFGIFLQFGISWVGIVF